ncbi:hypothetical protein [Flammeovirga aprica]|uniref:Uncharacterized protein n=1 Tax=Flammeovirga aprica JL-4 TaxID=694437 RepID=A0A7X9X9P4_9BACT|nr:hypothetical protein [Flammeovirga aprica]NME68980.1 hypothetical protein [Flammeovirga aprica JL-4]
MKILSIFIHQKNTKHMDVFAVVVDYKKDIQVARVRNFGKDGVISISEEVSGEEALLGHSLYVQMLLI